MSNVIIGAHFNLKEVKDPESNFYNIDNVDFNVLNNVSKHLVLDLKNEGIPTKLSFSTNGIDGIGYTNNDFNLNHFYYGKQKIYFTVKYKTLSGYDYKQVPKLNLNGVGTGNITLSCVKDGEVIPSTITQNETLSNIDGGGFFRGVLEISEPVEGIKIIGESNSNFGLLSGESTIFDIYPADGNYDYRKVNEDNDQTLNYKNLIFQDVLTNKDKFFDDFLGTIVGNVSSNPNTLGIKIYEKISNFVSNNKDINTSNLNGFLSQLDNLDIDFEKFNVEFPPSLQRIVDNLSLNLSIQKGSKNNYNFNFNDKGYVNSPLFGINKGNELDFETSILSAGMGKIVAYEKFSEKYTLLNTNLVSSYDFRYVDESTRTYYLSDYKDSWGWGLILSPQLGNRNFIQLQESNPDNTFLSLQGGISLSADNGYYRLLNEDFDAIKGDPLNISNFYEFYRYNDTIQGDYLQKYIDYDNENTNVGSLSSYTDYIKNGNFIDEIIVNNLFTNTGLVTSIVN